MQRTIGADYFKALYTRNKAQIDAFVELVGTPGTPLADLKAAYAEARPLYEQIETLAPAYPDEDAAIDARPDAYELGAHFLPIIRCLLSWTTTLCQQLRLWAAQCGT